MYEGDIKSLCVASLLEGDERLSDSPEWAGLFGGIPVPHSAASYGLCRFCEAHAAVVDAALPWLAAEIGRNDGHPTMLRFIHRWIGTRIYVPKDHSHLVEKVGIDLGAETHDRLLRDVGGGSQVEIPSAWGIFLALRCTAIDIAIRSRLSHADISRRFGVIMRSLR